MFRLIFLALLALLGYQVEPVPKRLNRKLTIREKIKLWFHNHKYELLLLLAIVAMIVIVLALVWFFPAMDGYNNRCGEVI